MDSGLRSGVIPFAEAKSPIPGPAGEHFGTALTRGTLRLLLSLPVNPNQQKPHEQDELYFAVQGEGVLVHDGQRSPFTAGDAMFVAAGTAHHFADFTQDFAVWVVFYGPTGGEA